MFFCKSGLSPLFLISLITRLRVMPSLHDIEVICFTICLTLLAQAKCTSLRTMMIIVSAIYLWFMCRLALQVCDCVETDRGCERMMLTAHY